MGSSIALALCWTLALALASVRGGGIRRWMCDRVPDGATREARVGDGGYEVRLLTLAGGAEASSSSSSASSSSSSSASSLRPAATYVVEIRNRFPSVPFSNFLLVAVPAGLPARAEYQHAVGQFRHLAEPTTTQSLADCPGVVTGIRSAGGSARFRKVRLHWTAPRRPPACVTFRTTVEYVPNEYFKDAEGLTRTICLAGPAPGPGAAADRMGMLSDSPAVAAADVGDGAFAQAGRRKRIRDCCACGHAVYRMQVRGLWTRHNHPLHFPSEGNRAHWTSIIGVTHSAGYAVYHPGGKATPSVRAVCAAGDTRKLEAEFKSKGAWNVLNVIKTHSLWGEDNLDEARTALFSVNSSHHLVSFLSKLGPSPDWCAGADDVDLCQSDCSWRRTLRLSLRPWDAGSVRGRTYRPAAAAPEDDVIRYLGRGGGYKSGPFEVDADGRARPVAELVITRTRPAHDWACDTDARQELPLSDRPPPPPPAAGQRRSWHLRLEAEEASLSDQYAGHGDGPARIACLVSPWGSWAACSSTCGPDGVRRRTRRLELNEADCQAMFNLTETEPCTPAQRSCSDTGCSVGSWQPWSRCLAECSGHGKQERSRELQTPDRCPAERQREIRVREVRGCYRPCDPKKVCALAFDAGADCPVAGTGAAGQRFYYNVRARRCQLFRHKGCRGNGNRFRREDSCLRFCKEGLSVVPAAQLRALAKQQAAALRAARAGGDRCELPSDSGRSCQDGAEYQTLWYFDAASGRCERFGYNGCGGNANRFSDRRLCARACAHRTQPPAEPADCLLSSWEAWTSCSGECSGQRRRSRTVLRHPANGGHDCPPLVEQSRCPACCRYTQWSDWSSCSRTCTHYGSVGMPSIKERRRQRLTPAGEDCTAKTIVERQECLEYRNTGCPGAN